MGGAYPYTALYPLMLPACTLTLPLPLIPAGAAKKPASGKLATSKKKKKQPALSRAQVKPMDREFGNWERHTTGFGSKMLAKMGWRQGSGLGSGGEGIVNPVRAVSHKEFGKGLAHMQVNKVGEWVWFEDVGVV